jgi:hypothetical protein
MCLFIAYQIHIYGPNIVNSSNVVNCPNVVNDHTIVNSSNVVNDHTIVNLNNSNVVNGQCITCFL